MKVIYNISNGKNEKNRKNGKIDTQSHIADGNRDKSYGNKHVLYGFCHQGLFTTSTEPKAYEGVYDKLWV